MASSLKSAWKCDTCNDEVSPTRNDETSSEYRAILESIEKMSKDVTQKFSEVNKNVSEVKTEVVNVNSAIDGLKVSLQHLAAENELRKKEVEEVMEDNKTLRKEITELKGQVLDLQQYTRRNNIEVMGVPLTNNEDVFYILKKIAELIQVEYRRDDISVAHRLPLPRSSKNQHPPIVAQFISKSVKAEWMAAYKHNRDSATASALHSSFKPTRIYINDHLTASNKATLGHARDMVRKNKLVYAWTIDSKIWVRRTKDGRATRVMNKEEVDAVVCNGNIE